MSRLPAHRRAALAAACLGAALGCASETEVPASSDGEAASHGQATLAFTCKGSVHSAAKLVDPLKGTVYGNLFATEDVNVAGPIADATEWGAVEVAGLDLVGAGKVDGAFQTPKLPAGAYTFLGFFDVDGNGAASKDPDPGDPVTLAVTNKFKIEAGVTVAYTVTFDLVYN